MKKLSYDIALLDKYLSGDISESELTQLKNQFENVQAFEREAKIQLAITEGIRSAGNQSIAGKAIQKIEEELRKENFFENTLKETQNQGGINNLLGEIEDELEEEGYYEKMNEQEKRAVGVASPSEKIKKLYPYPNRISIAASILLAVCFLWSNTLPPINPVLANNTKKQLKASKAEEQLNVKPKIKKYQEEYDLGKVGYANGIPHAQLGQLLEGLKAYQNGDTQKAFSFLSDFLANYPDNETANYFLGLCLMENQKHKEAHTIFTKKIYVEYKDNTLFYNALCLFKLDKKKEANEILKEIANGNFTLRTKASKIKT